MILALGLLLSVSCPQDPTTRPATATAAAITARGIFEGLHAKALRSSRIPGLSGSQPERTPLRDEIAAALATHAELFATGEGGFWRARLHTLAGQYPEASAAFLAHAEAAGTDPVRANEARARAALLIAPTNPELAERVARRVKEGSLEASLRADFAASFPSVKARPPAGPLDDKPLPELPIEKVLGGPDDLTLEQMKGTVLVVEFFATWCGPCRASIAALARLQEQKQHLGLQVVGATILYGMGHDFPPDATETAQGKVVQGLDAQGEHELVARFMKSLGFNYPVVFTNRLGQDNFLVKGLPTIYVIGRDGTIVGSVIGADSRAIEALVDIALAKPIARPKKH